MEPLTFDDISAMDDETLNLAIEQHCATRSNVPHLHYTASWALLMPLWWTHGRFVGLVRLHDGECWVSLPPGLAEADGTCLRQSMLRCTTEAETRRAVCQMTLWYVLWQQRQEAARGNT